MKYIRSSRICNFLALVLATLPSLRGQAGAEQSIGGMIMDPAGAAVVGAKVVIRNLDNGIRTELLTNADGLYSTPLIKPGEYEVEVSNAGFQTLVRKGLTLYLGQTLRLDLQLRLGEVNQTVEVAGTAPVLNTEDPRLGESIEKKAVQSLPMRDRRLGGLLSLAPGVYYEGEDAVSYNAPRFTIAGSGNILISIDGGGMAIQQGRLGNSQMDISPPLESIQEVQVQESFYGAQYGGHEGGMVRMTTKSGVNDFHGSGFEYYRNENLDSRQFFAADRQQDRYHLFGGSIGGPIKKNRAFFFASGEGNKASLPVSGAFTVPNVAMKSGDFSALGRSIYDPGSNRPDPNAAGRFLRDVFPGNRIPSSRFDPVAAQVLSLVPDVTQAGANNFSGSWTNTLDRKAWAVKGDYLIGPKDQLTGTWMFDKTELGVSGLQGFKDPAAIPDAQERGFSMRSQAFVFSETHTYSPTLVNSARFDYLTDPWTVFEPGYNPSARWIEKLGLKNTFADLGFPPFRLTGYMPIGSGSLTSPNGQHNSDYMDDLMWVRGKHTLKFGNHTMWSKGYNDPISTPGGSFNFDQNLTNLPGLANSGDSVASFLLGAVSSASMVRGAVRRNHEVYTAFYVADTFRATSKLTLDLGLRWELDFPFHEVSGNLLSNVNLSVTNPVSGTPGVITFADVDSQPLGLWNTDYKRFHPRIGFAYKVGSKTVMRGGYGLYGVSPGVKPNNVGFDPVNVSFATTDNGLTPAFYLRDGFPAWQKGGDRSKLNSSFGAVRVGQVPTTNPTWVQRDYRLGYAQNFNISVQQELPGQIMFEVAGIGALGRRLNMNVEHNEVPRSLWGLTGNAQVRRPFPQFGNVTQNMAAEGITDYYGLSVKTTKRLSRGLLFMSSFTLQKTVGVMSYQAKDDHKLSRGVSLFQEANQPRTAPYREFRLSWVYDLPFGPGKARLASGAASKIFGGWSVGGILSLYGGNPFGLSSPTGSLNCFCGADGRLDQIGDLTVAQPTISKWFNTGAVRPAAFGRLGTLGITPPNLIGPDLKNVDASVSKAVKVKERYTIKGSVEVFNISNTPKFGQPGTVFGSSSFGSIGGYRGVGTGSNVSPPWFGARIMQVGARVEF